MGAAGGDSPVAAQLPAGKAEGLLPGGGVLGEIQVDAPDFPGPGVPVGHRVVDRPEGRAGRRLAVLRKPDAVERILVEVFLGSDQGEVGAVVAHGQEEGPVLGGRHGRDGLSGHASAVEGFVGDVGGLDGGTIVSGSDDGGDLRPPGELHLGDGRFVHRLPHLPLPPRRAGHRPALRMVCFVVVDLAEGLGVISVVLEVLGEAGVFPEALAIEGVAIGVVSGGVGPQSEHQGHARRTALGCLAVGSAEGGPPGGQPVDAGGLDGLLSVGAQQGAQIVGGDEQDVGAVPGRGGRQRRRQQRQGGGQQAQDGPSHGDSALELHDLGIPFLPVPSQTGQGPGPRRGRNYSSRGFHQPSSSRSISCRRLFSRGLPARLFNSLGSAVKSNSISPSSEPSGRINL